MEFVKNKWLEKDIIEFLIEGYTNKYDKYYVLFLATIFPVDLAGYF